MTPQTRRLIEMALEEDLNALGDLTSQHFVDANHRSVGRIMTREPAIISGSEIGAQVCAAVSEELRFDSIIPDGGKAKEGDLVALIVGPTRLVLTAERTVLNFMQRLCGVATITRAFVDAISGTKARLLDTRKTTPGWRTLEKAAVLHGGGLNHRMGLYDAIMVKDNHLTANPSPIDLAKRIAGIKSSSPHLKIEVEADRLDQLDHFLRITGIDVILLDNMNPADLTSAVTMRNKIAPSILLEASGGVNLSTVRAIAATGVDFISVGALTHSVKSIDLGLDLLSGNE